MKKFGFYFKKGFVLTSMAMKGKGFFTKLLLGLYLILSFFGKLIFFLRPIFLIADNNLAMMVVEGHDVEIDKIFEGINSKKRYSSLLLSCIFVDGLSLVAAAIMVGPFLAWELTSVSGFPLYNTNLPPYIFIIIFGVVALVLTFVLQLMYCPMGFVTCKGKDLSCGDVLYLAKQGSASVKGKIIGISLINYLFILIFLAIFLVPPFVLAQLFFDDMGEVAIFVNFTGIVLFIIFMLFDVFVLSTFRMSMKISLYSVFFDNVEAKHVIIARKGNLKDSFVPLFSDDKEEID